VRVRLDGFSGYAVFRSATMKKLLRDQGICLDLVDDKADYPARMLSLREGEADLAVFTVDSFLKAGMRFGDKVPATVVMIIDQTKGADSVVAYSAGLSRLEDLNHPDARFVFTPSSPSEFLARIIVGQLSLPRLPEKWYKEADGAEDVLKKLKAADPKQKYAYVLWEPQLTQALKVKGVKKIFGSDKCNNCIVDVLVARREFLAEKPDLVRTIVENYFRAQHSYATSPNGMSELVGEDAKALGTPFAADELQRAVAGIEFKGVMDNYVHFGLAPPMQGVQPLEDIFEYVGGILVRTSAIPSNLYKGQANRLYYDALIRKLHEEGFHPGKKQELVSGFGPGAGDLPNAHTVEELPPLSDAEWGKLTTVGTARVPPIGFNRGTAEISAFSQEDLDVLAQQLGSLSTYYLRIVGEARPEGDAAANAQLATDRAAAVVAYLTSKGISASRLKPETAKASADGAAEVSFVLLQRPY
jgi:outer membrane protein OmpA-like peptidoglycan-associated protein/ABC-type nitrate/sulfonate/bicarbonate transport system substrate-binding protein